MELRLFQKEKIKRWSQKAKEYQKKFLEFINDDLNIPKGLSLAWKLARDQKISDKEKYFLLLDFDRVFGLKLNSLKPLVIPQRVKDLVEKREKLRKAKQWQKADKIRQEIEKLGYLIEDTPKGPRLRPLK